jgi:hypothetical protein
MEYMQSEEVRLRKKLQLREWRKNNPEKHAEQVLRSKLKRRTGAPHGPKPKDPSVRFWALVDKTDACWLWKGATNKRYGQFETGTSKKTKPIGAHRFAMKLAGFDIQTHEGHHVCPNKHCVRIHPEHVVPVPRRKNPDNPTYVNKLKSFCKRGHLLEGDNLLAFPCYLKKGYRQCKTCWNSAESRAKRTAAKSRYRAKLRNIERPSSPPESEP